jgi:hypothetical protein
MIASAYRPLWSVAQFGSASRSVRFKAASSSLTPLVKISSINLPVRGVGLLNPWNVLIDSPPDPWGSCPGPSGWHVSKNTPDAPVVHFSGDDWSWSKGFERNRAKRYTVDPVELQQAWHAEAEAELAEVKERQEWWDRVRGADGRQQWIRAADLRPASGSQP